MPVIRSQAAECLGTSARVKSGRVPTPTPTCIFWSTAIMNYSRSMPASAGGQRDSPVSPVKMPHQVHFLCTILHFLASADTELSSVGAQQQDPCGLCEEGPVAFDAAGWSRSRNHCFGNNRCFICFDASFHHFFAESQRLRNTTRNRPDHV